MRNITKVKSSLASIEMQEGNGRGFLSKTFLQTEKYWFDIVIGNKSLSAKQEKNMRAILERMVDRVRPDLAKKGFYLDPQNASIIWHDSPQSLLATNPKSANAILGGKGAGTSPSVRLARMSINEIALSAEAGTFNPAPGLMRNQDYQAPLRCAHNAGIILQTLMPKTTSSPDIYQLMPNDFPSKELSHITIPTDSIPALLFYTYLDLLLMSEGKNTLLTGQEADIRDLFMITGTFISYDDMNQIHLVKAPAQIKAAKMVGVSRLHSRLGPALEYKDGFKVYAISGYPLSENFFLNPTSVPAQTIFELRNEEYATALIRHYGYKDLISQYGVSVIDKSPRRGTLMRVNLPMPRTWKAHHVLEVLNASPEPDGSYQTFYLRVPPNIKKAEQAVAWTFGLRERDYMPFDQS